LASVAGALFSRYLDSAAMMPSIKGETRMTFADACIALGVMIAFATLILKIVEVSRSK
jgi:hypothetical protein